MMLSVKLELVEWFDFRAQKEYISAELNMGPEKRFIVSRSRPSLEASTGSDPVKIKKVTFPVKAVAFLAIAGSGAGIIACGGGSEEQTPTKNPETIAPTQTIEPTIETTSTPIVTEIPKLEGRVLTQAELIQEIKDVYATVSGKLPKGACDVETVTAVVVSLYEDAIAVPGVYNHIVIANGLAPIAGDVNGIIETIGSGGAPQLAADLEAISRFEFGEYAKENGVGESQIEGAMEAWRINAKNLSSFEKSECIIEVAPK